MPSDERDLAAVEQRVQAISAVRRVVHAIGAISRAQLPLVERAVAEASVYLDWVDQVVHRLAGPAREAREADVLWVAMGPERAYSGALARQLAARLPGEGALGVVGTRLAEFVDDVPGAAGRVRFRLPSAASYDEHDAVGRAVAAAILEHGKGATVELVHPTPQGTRTVRLLGGRRAAAHVPPETWSPLRVVLDHAVTESVSSRITVAVAETLRAETLARIAAAERAVTACDERLESLAVTWRVARQEQITTELLEVVAGRLAGGALV